MQRLRTTKLPLLKFKTCLFQLRLYQVSIEQFRLTKTPEGKYNTVSNHCNRSLACLLVMDALDNLEQVARTRELTNILWDINFKINKTEQEWNKVEILLESYEKMRDESLEAALINLRNAIEILCRS